jgi:hypothetical protein
LDYITLQRCSTCESCYEKHKEEIEEMKKINDQISGVLEGVGEKNDEN